MLTFTVRIWMRTVLIVSVVTLGSSEPSHSGTTLFQEAQEVCYHYRLVVAIKPKDNDLLPIRVVDIWRQGSLLKVEERGRLVFLRNHSRSVLIEPKENRGIFVDEKEMDRLLLAAGGLSFLTVDAFLTTELPRSEPTGTEVIDGISCGIFPIELANVRATVWIPLKRPSIPLGFLRARLKVRDSVVLEARVVLWERQSPRPMDFFEANTSISLAKVEELDIAMLIASRWEEEIGALECNPQSEGGDGADKK